MIRASRICIWSASLAAALAVVPVAQDRTQPAPADVEALLAAGAYGRAEVSARADVDALRAAHGAEALEVANASDALVRALILNGKGVSSETLALARKTLRVREAALGNEAPELVSSLLNLGDALIAAGDYRAAVASMQRAVALRQLHHGPLPLDLAEALDKLGTALSEAGRQEEALDALQWALRLKESSIDHRSAGIARTLERIGLVCQRRANYERAGMAIRRAESIQRDIAATHPEYVTTLNLLAQQLWFEGRLPESKKASERAVSVSEQALRADHPMVAQSLRYLAGTVADLGDLTRSHALKQRALVIVQQNFGPSHYETALNLNSVGLAELELGMYTTARARFEQVRTIMTARFGHWHDFVATALLNLAMADARLGDFAAARREQAAATAIWERVYGPNHAFVAVGLAELATVLREQRSPLQALPLLERALAIREKMFGSNHRDVARTLADLASTLMQIGPSARAQQLASRALGIWRQLDAPDAPEYATVLALYAQIQGNRGDYAAARDYYERALHIRGRVFGTVHPTYTEAQSGLGLALANLRERDAALVAAASAETTGRDHLQRMLRSLPERQALNYAAARPRGLNLILSLSDSVPDAIPLAIDGLIHNRALVLDEIAARYSRGRSPSELTDPHRLALRSAQQRLANLMARGPGQMSPSQYATVVEDTRRESELAEQALAERSAGFSAERSRSRIGLQEVMASLPADSVLLSFGRYDRMLFSGLSRSVSSTIPSYVAFVLRAQQAAVVVPLGSVQAIDALVSRWRADIAAEALAPAAPPEPVRSSRESGAALRRRVWDPVAVHLADANRVFVVPDGLLNLVPFAALPVGKRSYLLEDRLVIHYLTAERDLVPAERTSTPERGLLAIGGPSFDDRTLFRRRSEKPVKAVKAAVPVATLRDAQACGDFRAARFDPLTGALQEVKELSGLWTSAARPNKDVADARVLMGREASEGTFKQEAHRYRVLHLATHGFFLGDCSPVATGTRAVGGLSKAAKAKVSDNPLLLSGLALAGANRRNLAGPDEDDGILTAEEVTSLNLEGVEWAVLSACDTGLGEIKAGEGVFGLRRAFQVAGAHTVIMSLWSVEDRSALRWMRALYEGRLRRGLSTADAVRDASLTVLSQRRARGQSTHPFFWAGFVASGDWR